MAKRTKSSLRGTLGQRVKEFRLSLNMSQTELAERARIRQPLVSKMERGRGNPTLELNREDCNSLGRQRDPASRPAAITNCNRGWSQPVDATLYLE